MNSEYQTPFQTLLDPNRTLSSLNMAVQINA